MDAGHESLDDILVIDDNPGDQRFIEEAFRRSDWDPTIHTENTREEALDFVYQRGKHEDATEPDVILLDWNLSQTTGKEVLKAAKSGDSPIPVVVMSGSKPAIDREKSHLLQADKYIEKPTEPEGYLEPLRSLLSDQ